MLLMQLCKCAKTAKKEKEKLPNSFHTLLVAVGSRNTKKKLFVVYTTLITSNYQ